MKKSRPDSYQPPYPAYQSHFASGHDDFVMAMASVQARQQSAAEQLTNELLALLLADRECKPLHVERGTQMDASGYHNDVFMPYWKDKQDMHGFWEREDVQSWMSKPRKGDAGWWRETIVAPVTSLDGNYSLEKIDYGVGRYVEQKLEQFHAYFGSMRDRVVDYLSGEADGKKGQITRRDAVDSFGKRMRISEMPDKLCFIRGPFGWDKATEEEQQAFIDYSIEVLPFPSRSSKTLSTSVFRNPKYFLNKCRFSPTSDRLIQVTITIFREQLNCKKTDDSFRKERDEQSNT